MTDRSAQPNNTDIPLVIPVICLILFVVVFLITEPSAILEEWRDYWLFVHGVFEPVNAAVVVKETARPRKLTRYYVTVSYTYGNTRHSAKCEVQEPFFDNVQVGMESTIYVYPQAPERPLADPSMKSEYAGPVHKRLVLYGILGFLALSTSLIWTLQKFRRRDVESLFRKRTNETIPRALAEAYAETQRMMEEREFHFLGDLDMTRHSGGARFLSKQLPFVRVLLSDDGLVAVAFLIFRLTFLGSLVSALVLERWTPQLLSLHLMTDFGGLILLSDNMKEKERVQRDVYANLAAEYGVVIHLQFFPETTPFDEVLNAHRATIGGIVYEDPSRMPRRISDLPEAAKLLERMTPPSEVWKLLEWVTLGQS